MDYTTLEIVKEAVRAKKTVDDSLLTRLVGAASRAVDVICGQSEEAVDYFKLEDVTDEALFNGKVDVAGRIVCWPHKSVVHSVAALSYRFNPVQTWQVVPANMLTVERGAVMAYTMLNARMRSDSMRPHVVVSYNGGMAVDTAGLRQDFIDAVTVVAARMYREEETGLTDAVGVAELGTVTYTKAWPTRVIDMLNPFTRRVPW